MSGNLLFLSESSYGHLLSFFEYSQDRGKTFGNTSIVKLSEQLYFYTKFQV
jgi:hypothetical protein